MSFLRFLRDRIISIIIFTMTIIFISELLHVTRTNFYVIFFVILSLTAASAVCLLLEFFRKRLFYKELVKSMEMLEKSYLLSEVIDSPSFFEGEILYEALKISNKAMNDQIAKYKLAMEEYREYIETWVHEVKTPISSSMLIIENNQNDVTKSLAEEVKKIDGYVQQALFYSRSNTVEKDYIIKECNLEDIVKSSIKINSKVLIENKVSVAIDEMNYVIFTDGKWIDFILTQIISNSVKYKSDNSLIRFSAKENQNSISLFVEDNGIGISKKDISRVFDKGFTGENGRNTAKSTGIGLYLCKKLCKKLGLDIKIVSKKGTTVEIIFPKGKLTNL